MDASVMSSTKPPFLTGSGISPFTFISPVRAVLQNDAATMTYIRPHDWRDLSGPAGP